MSDPSQKIALSSCWCSQRHTDGYEMAKEMADLGFEYIELSHGIRITLVEGILRAIDEGMVKISSVHNFCPLPSHVTSPAPNLYEPTSKDIRELDLWLRYTRRTLEFAGQVGADICVVHSGSVPFFWGDPARKLDVVREKTTGESPLDDAKYCRKLDGFLKMMRKKSARHMEILHETFSKVLPLAAEKGVRLAVENREGAVELPIDTEMVHFLAEFPADAPIGYWHDCGHAQIKENEGFVSHEQLLRENAKTQLGFHIHDVSEEGRDHQPVGSGVIDFEMVGRYIRPHHTLVLEFSPRLSSEAVTDSRKQLDAILANAAASEQD